MRVNDLFTDLRDGRLLMRLLEVLSGESVGAPQRGQLRVQCLANVSRALDFLSAHLSPHPTRAPGANAQLSSAHSTAHAVGGEGTSTAPLASPVPSHAHQHATGTSSGGGSGSGGGAHALGNIGPGDIVDGNPRLTLGLVWLIVLRFQIETALVAEVPLVIYKLIIWTVIFN